MNSARARTARVLVVATLAAAPLQAQSPPAGGVVGTVVAAATGEPLAGAVVSLEAVQEGAVVVPSAGRPFLARSLTAVTDGRGTYRFQALPAGTYRLNVRQIGYHPASVDIELAHATPFRVSIGMVVNPIRLEPVDIRGLPPTPYGRVAVSDEQARRDAERLRHQQFLESDATVLTHADVVEAVTLGETDLFRALQRLPGVSTRDDWTAAMWTRGAPWSQTRVYLDGLPLFNPVHATGLLTGVSPDAIGAATFHPGGRSASIGEGAAGVLALTTRGPSAPGVHGLGELSVVSARATGEWTSPGGRAGLLLTARRSYADVATRVAEWFGAESGTYIPYAFHDVVAHAGGDLGGGWGIEASGLWSRDAVDGGVPDLMRDTRGHWGNSIARVSLLAPPRTLRQRMTLGVSRFAGDLQPLPPSVTADTSPVHASTHNTITVWYAAVDIAPAGTTRAPWSAGLQATVQSQDFVGPYPRPYPEAVLPDTLVLAERHHEVALWAEHRFDLGRGVEAEAGLRLAARDPPLGSKPVGLALVPRLAARYVPGGGPLTLTAAWTRSWQYTQALAPAGPSVGPDLYVTDVWLLTNDTIPSLRSDIVTVGTELWLGDGWMGTVHGYARHSGGNTVPEPSPGILTSQRPIFVDATNRAYGVEVALRRLAGPWTAALSYSLGASNLTAVSTLDGTEWQYASPADRRHVGDATVMVRLPNGLRLGAAATLASGAPFTRFLLGVAPCDSTAGACPPPDTVALQVEAPSGGRTATYGALDLLADWSATWGGVRVGAYVQLRNVMRRANAITYTGSFEQCTSARPPELVQARPGICDRFERGVGFLPLAGLRVEF